MTFEEDRQPAVLSTANLVLAVALHLSFFVGFYLYSRVHTRTPPMIVPIELTFEAPPEEAAAKPPEVKPVEPPKPKVEPPKLEDKLEAVEKIVEKPKEKLKEKPKVKPPEKPKEKKPEVKKPDPPKKSAKELREEKLKQMRESSTVVKGQKTPVAGTGKKLYPDYKKALLDGAKPGATTQLAASEDQRCKSLIMAALDDKWDELRPKTGQPGIVYLTVSLSKDGRIHSCRIAKSCGSKMSDDAALRVASEVGRVYGLSPEFIAANPTFTIRYEVNPR